MRAQVLIGPCRIIKLHDGTNGLQREYLKLGRSPAIAAWRWRRRWSGRLRCRYGLEVVVAQRRRAYPSHTLSCRRSQRHLQCARGDEECYCVHTCHARRCWHAVPCATSHERYREFAEVVRRMTCKRALVTAFTGVQCTLAGRGWRHLGYTACRRSNLLPADPSASVQTPMKRMRPKIQASASI